ncbi:synaptic vesicle glycoprotein 2C [Halyomorpha halys]|uniref:synaptic vesicle glycoprotein 2C n=1 Tax=Halyomorpha halys TaxID=286706 RepID=UPI0006D526F9|nr:synaptic vesicle glycoprotein 2C-like [Halyomorpha halys]
MAVHRQDNVEAKQDRTCSIASDATIDLETAINKTGCGKFNWMIILLTFPVAGTSVFVTGSMSYVISVAAPDLDLTATGKAWLQSAPYAGMVVSGYIWGSLSDAFGRKNLMVIGFLSDFFLNIAAGLIKSLPVILFFKFMSGFMVCGPYSIFMVYMSEVFSQQHRDMIAQFLGVFTSVGSIIQSGLAMWLIPMVLPDWMPFKAWQLFTMCGGIPSLLIGLSCFFFYESPKFLVDKGRSERALSVCRNIFTINTGLPRQSFPVNKIYAKNSDSGPNKATCSRVLNEIMDMFRPPYLWKALTVFVIFIVMFGSQNTLRLWMPEIFTLLQNSSVTDVVGLCPLIAEDRNSIKITAPKDSVYLSMIVIHCCCLACHLLFAVTVKCIKRKILLIITIGVAGGCIFIVPWITANMSLLPISIYLALYEASIYAFFGAIVQIFPTHLRAKAVSLAMVLGRAAIFMGNFLLSNVMFTSCDEMFWSLAAGALCIVIFSLLLSFKPHDDSKITE